MTPAWREGAERRPCSTAKVGEQVRFYGEWETIRSLYPAPNGVLAGIGYPSAVFLAGDEPRWFRGAA